MSVPMQELIGDESDNEDNNIDVNAMENVDYKLSNVWYQLKTKPNLDDIKYENENGNPLIPMTSKLEVFGWIMYDVANSPYIQVGLALVVTLFITTNGTTDSCIKYQKYGCDINNIPIQSNSDIFVYVGNIKLKPESFYFFVFSIFGGVQLILYLMVGGLLDYKYYQYYIFIFGSLYACWYVYNISFIKVYIISEKIWILYTI